MNLKLLMILLVALGDSSASTFVKDKLYYFETYYKASWFKALMACGKMGMELLSIDSDAEFDKIHALVKDKVEYKEGLMIWTSAAMKEIGQFNWIYTGNPVEVSKWLSDQPNNFGKNEFCMHIWLYNKQFVLNDIRCDTEAHFICESWKV
ncbi:PREDICTED: C-type lectin 37Da-like [Nicrophorus vespilloides]|uniref:C-type lectin 37Da-like n=1 Tax=Nicrophorus vespilloides TaxID=110193 RepID=A0ABM1M102_NICVS|nr:PREDICTED: C-type lectin 37Da-like [Nicrophorus vespilloides]